MGRWDVYNTMLLDLYEKSSHLVTVHIDFHAVIERLRLDDLVFSVIKEETTMFGGDIPTVYDKYTLYGITSSGIKLMSTLPADYVGRPYDYFLKQKEEAAKKEIDFKELITKVNKATIETTKWTKLMFIATLVIAIGTLVLAIASLYPGSSESKRLLQIERKVEQLDNRTLPQSRSSQSDSLGR